MDQQAFPIVIVQGVTYIQPFYYFDEDNLPIDLTGCTAQMQARQTINSVNPPILDWSTESGEITINAAAGCILVSASAAITAALAQTQDASYDILLTFESGVVEQLISGPINIIGQVTR